ncbi:MarR family winged helix-turn-helix transcriptional regulator [Pedomonas mirosovicensis]|uniref:MarR family winged helix-turn-helix transcriptional regulator n=1 Tax=Pedomonas mirosovicensis TaxID=2908641 RepID=UPI0035BBE605
MSARDYISFMSKTDPSAEFAPSGLDRFLCFGIYSTGLAFNRVYKPLLDKLGLTYPQYLAMVVLWQRDGQTVGELGEKLFLESNTITPLIKRLEAAGYLTRRRDTADERVVRVFLTETGRGLAQQAACVPEQILTASGITQEKLDEIQTALITLRRNLRASAGED